MTGVRQPIAEPGAGVGFAPRPAWRRRLTSGSAGPVLVVCLAILAVWYAGAWLLNSPVQRDLDRRQEISRTPLEFLAATMNQAKPTLPTPHQVAADLVASTVMTKPSSAQSLVYHAWVTLSSTLLGFLLGTALGILIAVSIVHARSLEKSLMPWIIASQTIPILAVAPMVIVVLAAIGLTGLLPKALISTYLSFFPVAVGMVKGLRSPEPIHLDLLATYNATRAQIFWKLRVPASVPFLFASMKVAVAISLVGAIVGELPTGAVAGIGSRLLFGSYYSQTIQLFSALVAASLMAALLVTAVGLVERLVLRRMGARA
jgi:NitT/TauT family transport system permease protein